MAKDKATSLNQKSVLEKSSESIFTEYVNKIRERVHILNTKVIQFNQKKSSKSPSKHSLQSIAQRYIHLCRSFEEPDQQIQEAPLQELQMYFNNHLLPYDYKLDKGKKWKVIFGPNLDLQKEDDPIKILAILAMMSDGIYPFTPRKQTKAKVNVKHLHDLKKRPSHQIQTFKANFGTEKSLVFSWIIIKSHNRTITTTCCIYVHQFTKDINHKKLDHFIDELFKQKQFLVAPGELKFQELQKQTKGTKSSPKKMKVQVDSEYETFGFNSKTFVFQSSTQQVEIRLIRPGIIVQDIIQKIQKNSLQTFQNFSVQVLADETNYKCSRSILKDLQHIQAFQYNLTEGQYDVLETKGNLIVVGRSGTGKTTCALFRLMIKQLENGVATNDGRYSKKKNLFLTASQILMTEISKKYLQIKEGINDYINMAVNQVDLYLNTQSFIQIFQKKLQKMYRQTSNPNKSINYDSLRYPNFLTIRTYIDYIDGQLDHPFFNSKDKNQIQIQKDIFQHPDKIQWEFRIAKTRKLDQHNQDKKNQDFLNKNQAWYEVDYEYFKDKFWNQQLKNYKSNHISADIVWAEIYSTIKGSCRAHTFYNKFLSEQVYLRESKNKLLEEKDKKKVYQIFQMYEQWKQSYKQYDLTDVVNNILIQVNKRKYDNLLLTSLFVDQVQDFPPSFIFLTGKIVQQSLYFSGDTAQTISKGVNFRFSDIDCMFSQSYFQNSFKLSKPITMSLRQNFRSQNQIIQLSNSLIRLIEMMFPSSIDKIPFETSPHQGMKPLVVKKNEYLLEYILKQDIFYQKNQKNLFGADKAIIVRSKKDKQNIPKNLSGITCLTYEQCKGLQYQVVILYDFFNAKQTQWNFLKHVQTYDRNGKTQISFDKSKFGSNITLYSQLCSQIKILYTIVTRPKTILIICDDHIPCQLLRIWRSMNLIKQIDSTSQYENYKYTLKKVSKISKANQKFQQHKGDLATNQDTQQKIYMKYKKEWAEKGIQMFFDRKNYSEAVRCFLNAQIPKLAKIAQGYTLAQYAYYNADKKSFLEAASVFSSNKQYLEAGKCFYLGESYQQALKCFQILNIRKYQAQAHWKMYNFYQAQKIFFNQGKAQKGIQIIVDTKYWFLFFSKLYDDLNNIQSKVRKIHLTNYIKEGSLTILKNYCASLMQNQVTFSSIQFQKIAATLVKNENYYKCLHFQRKDVAYQKMIDQQLKKTKSRFKIFQCKQQLMQIFLKSQSLQEILTDLITLIVYNYGLLKHFNLLKNYDEKYNKINLQQKVAKTYQSNNPKRFENIIKLFSMLQQFQLHKQVIYFSHVMNFSKLTFVSIVQNMLRINRNHLSQEIHQNYVHTHLYGVNKIKDQDYSKKITLLQLLFGRKKSLPTIKGNIGEVWDFYLDAEFSMEEKAVQQLMLTFNQRNYALTSQSYRTNFRIRPLQAFNFKQIYHLIDDLSLSPYFNQNIKTDTFINKRRLNNQQEDELRSYLQDEKNRQTKTIANSLKKYERDLKYKQDQRALYFKQLQDKQIQARNKVPDLQIKVQEILNNHQWFQNNQNLTLQNLQKYVKRKIKIRDTQLDKVKKQYSIKIQQIQKKVKTLNRVDQLKNEINTLKKQVKDLHIQNQQNQIQKQAKQDIINHLQNRLHFLNQRKSQIMKKNIQNNGSKQENQNLYGISNQIIKSTQQINQIKLILNEINQKSKKQAAQIVQMNKNMTIKQNNINQHIQYLLSISEIKKKFKNLKKQIPQNKKQRDLIEDQIHYHNQPAINKLKDQLYEEQNKIYGLHNPQKNILEDFIINFYDIPKQCKQKRLDQHQDVIFLRTQIDRLKTQKGVIQKDIQMRLRPGKMKQLFLRFCISSRSKYIRSQLLNKNQQNMTNNMALTLEFIANLEFSYSKYNDQRIKDNEKILNKVFNFKADSYERIFFVLYIIFHQDEIPRWTFIMTQKYFDSLYVYLRQTTQDIMQGKEQSQIIKKALQLHDCKIIQSQFEQLNYFTNFALIKKNNFFAQKLKNKFFYNICQNNILVKTSDLISQFKIVYYQKLQKLSLFNKLESSVYFSTKKEITNSKDYHIAKDEHNLGKSILNQIHLKLSKFKTFQINEGQIKNIFDLITKLKVYQFSRLINLNEKESQNINKKSELVLNVLDECVKTKQLTKQFKQLQRLHKLQKILQNKNKLKQTLIIIMCMIGVYLDPNYLQKRKIAQKQQARLQKQKQQKQREQKQKKQRQQQNKKRQIQQIKRQIQMMKRAKQHNYSGFGIPAQFKDQTQYDQYLQQCQQQVRNYERMNDQFQTDEFDRVEIQLQEQCDSQLEQSSQYQDIQEQYLSYWNRQEQLQYFNNDDQIQSNQPSQSLSQMSFQHPQNQSQSNKRRQNQEIDSNSNNQNSQQLSIQQIPFDDQNNQNSKQENKFQQNSINYKIISNCDSYGGDISYDILDNYEKAIQKAKQLIGTDTSKCATIYKSQPNVWQVILKNRQFTNQNDSRAQHSLCSLVIYDSVKNQKLRKRLSTQNQFLV